MRIIRIIAVLLIGVLLILSACAKPAPTTPAPPAPTAPTTPAPTAPTTPAPTAPTTPAPTAPTTPAPTTPTTPAPIPAPGPNEIWLPGREFRPSILTVLLGTKVTWTSKDSSDQHTVTSDTGLFNSNLSVGESFIYTFTERGTFTYNCQLHADMVGKIIVE